MGKVAKDPRNAISLAATYGAILGDPSDPDRPVPSTIFNVDVTSLNLGEAIVETALADGEEQEVLKRKGLNASQTKNEKKYRTAKVMTLISAQGTLDATIVIIKDDTLKQERLQPVSNNQSQPLTFLACERAVVVSGSRYKHAPGDDGHHRCEGPHPGNAWCAKAAAAGSRHLHPRYHRWPR
jgi:hypothetical protein